MEARIDGSLFEGGGQILRNSLALALILHRPVSIFNIRAGRPKPGLAHSHLASVLGLAAIGRAEVTGARVGATDLHFVPGQVTSGHYEVVCDTAGSIALMFQATLPCVLSEQVTVTFTVKARQGGSDVSFSPPTYFIKHVLAPTLAHMGVHFEYTVETYGLMPVGGGRVTLTSTPTE
jgi:RNA 3'-phosphate cyclase